MKSFEKFIKEEVDLRGNKGIPSDFMSKSEEEARRSLGVRLDDERGEMPRIYPDFQRNQMESERLLRSDQNGRPLSREDFEKRVEKLEKLAEKVVREEFDDVLKSGVKPVELQIKLVPIGGVTGEIPDIRDVPQQAEQPEDEPEDEPEDNRDDEEQDQDEQDQEEQSQEGEDKEEDPEEEIPGTNLVSAIDKKKLLNMITQAAGKSTKDIIRVSETVEEELSEIFGERQGKQVLDCWVRMSDLADKMDWVIPISKKSQMMKGMPQGMAGACQVKWESHTGNYYNMSLLLEKEVTKIVIKATGVDFPMLIHEAIKGVYLFLQSSAIKKDKETAKIIKKATSSFTDEAQDFRYGPPALDMLVKFVNKFPESNDYQRLDTKVYAMLAKDKEGSKEELEKAKLTTKEAKEKATKTGNIEDEYAAEDAEFMVEYLEKRLKFVKTDDQFLEIMNSLFSTFDLVGSNFQLNEEKFNISQAKDEISKIIKYIVDDIEEAKKEAEEYRKAMEDYNREQKEREEEEKWRSQQKEEDKEPSEEESDIDSLIRKTALREEDYSSMTPREIHKLIDEVLDDDSLSKEDRNKKIKTLSGFLPKESAQIFLRELERINEYSSKRRI
jgi:hypothetical protein